MPSDIYNDRIKFDNLTPGTIVSQLTSANGAGPISVRGTNLALGNVNAAIVFNSSAPTGGDFDLGSPNQSFGGPGVGAGGAAGAPFENSTALQRLLIVGDNLVDGNGDGLVDNPGDAEFLGTKLSFDFGPVGPVVVRSLTFIDVVASNPTAKVELFNAAGISLGIIELPATGNNGVATVTLPNVIGAARVDVLLNGSGGLDEIVFASLRISRMGDFVWCDDLIENGIADPGEPGLPGVRVALRGAGNDGLLDTADDVLAETFSDQLGRYLFSNLPPGLHRVTVDPSTAPPGKVPGLCPTVYEIFLVPFGVYRKADFCFVERPAEIGDFVWCDEDDDGFQDPLEPGLPGVDVALRCAGPDMQLGTADDILRLTSTDSSGHYLFTNVPAGLCRVTVNPATAPNGKVPGSNCPLSVTRTLAPSESYLDADFCFITPGEIGDFVWCDEDNDGLVDFSEPGIPGVTVDLLCAGSDGLLGTGDDIARSTVTNQFGRYLFTGVPSGLCRVTVDIATAPIDKVPGRCPTQISVLLPVGGSFLDADFCFITPGEVGDLVWCDTDDDGTRDIGEPGIAGARVQLRCAGTDGLLDTADDVVRNAVTNQQGAYLFQNVLPDLCVVRVDVTSGGQDKELGRCPPEVGFSLAPAQSFLEADFCFRFIPASLGDYVWCDNDNDGVQDPLEPGIDGVRVRLRCAGLDGLLNTADDLLGQRITSGGGFYLFASIPPGLCEATVDASTAPPNKVLGICPPVVTVTLAPAQAFRDADYCFVTPPVGSIGDFVWCDLDDDGVQDPLEPGIPGVLVRLRCAGQDQVLGTNDDIVDSRLTNASGFYLFESLPAGECRVTVEPASAPPGKIPGTFCPITELVQLGPGQSYLDADFCFIDAPARVGDKVFCDLDNNGVQTLNEPGIQGAAVRLRCAGADGLLNTADDIVRNTVTDNTGSYLFTGVPAGLCSVSVDPTTVVDKLPGICPLVVNVVLLPGDEFLEADFCFVEPGRIGDLVWCDIDNDGVRDPLEPGVEGVSVSLRCAGPDQVLGTADDITDQMVTDAAGAYLFTGLPAGPCRVTLVESSIPSGKEVGVCPPQVTVALASGQSFLDADFCIRFGPPGDCCEHGRPVQLTILYTGESCGATVTTQPPDKWSCSGNPMFASPVFVRASNKPTPTDLSGLEYFEGLVDVNTTFVMDAISAGATRFGTDTWIHTFDVTGTIVLQTVKFHTSCSQDLFSGQQYGSMRIVDCRGENEPHPGDCCEHGRPRVLTFRYTGESCSATSHAQEASKVSCSGNPNFAPQVFIRSSNSATPTNTSASIWFQGLVNLNDEFDMNAVTGGETRLSTDSWIHIFAPNQTTLLQTVKLHTSCSQPLFLGNQFGASLLVGCIGENEPNPGDCCTNGRPRELTFIYTGESCAASSHAMEAGKVTCSGDPAMAATVFIRSSNSATPTNTAAAIYFEGLVNLNTEFTMDATSAGLTRFGTDSWIHIFASNGTTLLQTVKFHTSCSQPLFLGNQFGASLLVGCVGENEPPPGGGMDVCVNGRPRVLLMQYTGNSCAASSHSQAAAKVSCSGDPALASPVYVRASNNADPMASSADVWFTGNVLLNGIIDLDANRAGENSLSTDSFLHVYNVQGGTLLQTVRFHTSCSQPLFVGNVFGAFVITGFTSQ